jgi:hypothetical protein
MRSLRAKLAESWIMVEDAAESNSVGSSNYSALFAAIDALPLLDCVLRESLRLIPAVHSSIRVATQDDEIPLSEPVAMKDGTKRSSVRIQKGQFAHVAVEGLNLDRGAWGETGWEFESVVFHRFTYVYEPETMIVVRTVGWTFRSEPSTSLDFIQIF